MRPILSAVVLAALTLFTSAAQAEGRLRIAEQFGVVYLMLNVAQDQKLIEKHGRQQGVDIKVDWIKLSGGNAANDALLGGSIDVAGAGVGPLLTIWDRTRERQNVRGVASLGNFPYYLVSTNPAVKTIADFTERDRIALPAASVSVQARILQMAAARQWGVAASTRLDRFTQSLPHPDATSAIIAGGTEINAHFATPLYQDQELAGNPKAHVVLDSYAVQGGPGSSTVLYASEKFVKENPKTVNALVAALAEAAAFIKAHPDQAADAYLRVNGSKTDRALLLKVITDPKVEFKVAPENTQGLAAFMAQAGVLKNKPASWRDYFFAHPLLPDGS